MKGRYGDFMAGSRRLVVELSARTEAKLKALSRSTGRSDAAVAAEAIASYVEARRKFVEAVREGERAAARGEVIPHEQMQAWARSLGSAHPLPVPRVARGGSPPLKSRRLVWTDVAATLLARIERYVAVHDPEAAAHLI